MGVWSPAAAEEGKKDVIKLTVNHFEKTPECVKQQQQHRHTHNNKQTKTVLPWNIIAHNFRQFTPELLEVHSNI